LPPPPKFSRTAACEEAIAMIEADEVKFDQIYP
jgi:hypothetical protein